MTLQPKSATAPLTGPAGLLGLALAVAMLVDRSWPVHLQAMNASVRKSASVADRALRLNATRDLTVCGSWRAYRLSA
ncbi:hypothetical protein NKH80_11165 [Mesorhizobium sp. M0904]|uniref:hypothetical protein n=1 Tax=unclassified Mesorhizobium TaxID=325217 RepID=UPI00333C67AC